MLKNKAIFKSIAVALIMFMMVAALSPSVGMVYATTGPQETQVEYSVGETEWTFSVPAAQTFGTGNLVLTGSAVAISPKNNGDVISLPNGQEISITIDSANNFELHRAINDSKNSVIAYSVYKVNGSEDVLLNKGNTVLTYTAGTSLNTGVSQDLKFVTTEQKIQNATITGEHTDTLTFTVNVSGGTSGGGSESGGSTTPTPTDLLAGTWVFNNIISRPKERYIFNFITYNYETENYDAECYGIGVSGDGPLADLIYYSSNDYSTGPTPYNFGVNSWSEKHQTIIITSKLSEVENGEALLAYLQANATK